jgi:hypothetical protein
VSTDDGFCAARSKVAVPGKPDSYFICTNDQDHHLQPAHTACDGHGHVLARWTSETSAIETWIPYAGVTMRVVIP